MTRIDNHQPIWRRHVLLTALLTTIVLGYQAPWYSYLTQRQLSSSESRKFVTLVKDPEKLCQLLKSRLERKPDDITARRLLANCNGHIAKIASSRESQLVSHKYGKSNRTLADSDLLSKTR